MRGSLRFVYALVLGALITLPAAAQTRSPSVPKRITVAIATDFPPHSIADDLGQLQGMRPEMWNLWSQTTGIEVRFIPVSWGKAAELVASGKADVADPVAIHQNLAERLELSKVYYEFSVHAFFNTELSGVSDVPSLRGYAVAVGGMGGCQRWLAEHGILNLRPYSDLEAMVRGGANHEAEVFCTGKITGLSYLAKFGQTGHFRYTAPLYTSRYHWGVRKGGTALRDLIQDGFDRIPKAEGEAVNQHWLGSVPEYRWRPEWLRQAAAAGVGILAVMLLLLGWNRSLLHRVARAVAEGEKAWQALHEREKLFAAIATQAPSGIVMVDCETLRFVEFNDVACRGLGYSREEFALLTLNDVADLAVHSLEQDGTELEKHCTTTFETLHRRRDGSQLDVQVNVTKTDIGGKPHFVAIWTDVSERSRMEAALATREREFRTLAENAPDNILRYDTEGRVIYANQMLRVLAGVAPSLLIGKTPLESHAPGLIGVEAYEAALRRTLLTGEASEVEVMLPPAPGDTTMCTHHVRFVAERNVAGNITGALAFGRDITERKRMEEALRHSEAGLKEAQRIGRLGNWELDLVTKQLIWSDEIYRIFEIDPEKFGATYEAFLDAIYPDDRDLVGTAYADSVRDRIPYDIVHRLLMADGRVKHVHERGETIYDEQGWPLRSVGTVLDVTEAKTTEDALRFVAQKGWSVEEGGFQTAVVRYLGEALGVDYVIVDRLSDEPGMAETVAAYAKGDVVPNMRYALDGTPCANVLDGELCSYPSGIQQLFPCDTRLVDMAVESYVGIPLWDSDGTVFGLVAVLDGSPLGDREDYARKMLQLVATRAAAELEREMFRVTQERLQAERLLLEHQVQETRKLEALGKLAGGIAHDFNNILGAILGFGEFIVEDLAPNHPALRYATRIVAAGQRGKALVNQILAFARRKEAVQSRIRLADLLTECEPMLHVAIPSSIRIVSEFGADSVEIDADRDQIAQAVMNLCFNARDAMENRTGTLTIGVEFPPGGESATARGDGVDGGVEVWTEGDGTVLAVLGRCRTDRPYAVLFVRDTGGGMDAALLSSAFDPFFTTKEMGKGTGLGLSVVHGIVMGHHGAVVVRSHPGHGTEFRIILPVADSNSAQEAAPSRKLPQAVSVGSRNHALVVDDDEAFGDMLTTLLKRKGWRVTHHTIPVEALASLKADPDQWTVLITDQTMPDMRGHDLIRAAKEIRTDLRCILCTGYDDTLDDEVAARLGIAALLQKPLDTDALWIALEDAALQRTAVGQG